MERQTFKKLLILSVFGISLVFLASCGGEKKGVSGLIPQKPAEPGLNSPAVQPTGLIFAGSFRIVNSGVYETLMKTCARCGTKRLIETPFGTRYERYWSFGESLKECTNWLTEGFLQLEFTERKLPTSVKVQIQPKYKGSSDDVWGFPFELTATAQPINENQGFEIFISPNQGLGGVYSLILSSDSTNPVQYSELFINILYGPQGQVVAHPNLKKYDSSLLSQNTFYKCGEYPPL